MGNLNLDMTKVANVWGEISQNLKEITPNFVSCTSLTTIDLTGWNPVNISKMIPFTDMNLNQIKYAKAKGLVHELDRRVSVELNLCPFYANIPSENLEEFEAIK
jgi:hypothetical protein